MRVLVCGGRDFNDQDLVLRVLNSLHGLRKIHVLIEGGARGADRLAYLWAFQQGVTSVRYPADWKTYGRAAGHIRNSVMLTEGRPDLVVAFPGGKGTADMVGKARAAGLAVQEVNPRDS